MLKKLKLQINYQLDCNGDSDRSKRIKCVQQDKNVVQVESFSKNEEAKNNNDTEININLDSSMMSAFELVLKSNHLSSKDLGRVMLRMSRGILSELDKR